MRKWFIRDPRMKLKYLLEKEMTKHYPIFLFYIDVAKLSEIELQYGFDQSSNIIHALDQSIARAVSSLAFHPIKYIHHHRLWGDDYCLCMSWEADHAPEHMQDKIHELCIQLKDRIELHLNKQISLPAKDSIRLHIGFSKLTGKDVNKEIYQAVKSASQMAKYDVRTKEFLQHRHFFQILQAENLNSYYQPLVTLKDGSVYGWEGLIRGPENSEFFLPSRLFDYAEKTGRSLMLDSICRRKVLGRLAEISADQKIFINVDPRSIEDTNFFQREALYQLDRHGLSPQNIVLEITERHAITNFTRFRELIGTYRKLGYLIAVDDAGAGYSSLETIVQTYPDFIKLDMSLTRSVDADPVKKAIVEAFVTFARKVGCKIIAEGIETKSELESLLELQVDIGQGYFLGRPAHQLCQASGQAMTFFETRTQQDHPYEPRHLVRHFTMFPPTFPIDTKVKKIHQIFEEQPLLDHVIILDGKKAAGLVMRQHLYGLLGGQYGVPLYREKEIHTIMDSTPLKVDQYTPIEEASKAAMARDPQKLYDAVIITKEGDYCGSITIQRLLEQIAQAKLEWATLTNPLTQLPGNILIEREMERRIQQGQPFHIVYCDLDHFKLFNDTYGFERGDEIILRTAHLIQRNVIQHGHPRDFVGHIGGDDFLFITCPALVHHLAERIKEQFMFHMQDFVCEETDCERVCLSLSMAGIQCEPGQFRHVSEIAALAAKVKKLAKSRPGSSFATDEEWLMEVK
ncbi:GGDEF domain-containing protein [Ammoniphilus sp. YIM 78166]|uniref:GGDEF domain-containing protein n=1 Tax=Ammoniphilus sp. YIM 78166 TaxID=1644106 RepID=UPI00143073A7|nr:GGDEF domain-containing protein [Ammoniphilus sp. YIM 78166]